LVSCPQSFIGQRCEIQGSAVTGRASRDESQTGIMLSNQVSDVNAQLRYSSWSFSWVGGGSSSSCCINYHSYNGVYKVQLLLLKYGGCIYTAIVDFIDITLDRNK